MAEVSILVCACGLRLKAAGAVPGRVGRCPSCGAELRVPEKEVPVAPEPDEPSGEPGYGVGPAAEVRAPTAYRPQTIPSDAARRRLTESKERDREGLLRPPPEPESGLVRSLAYPLWGSTGLVLLVLMPPAFWITTAPMFATFGLLSQGGAGSVIGVIGFLPGLLTFLVVAGFTLLYLGKVLVSAAIGEVHHPRWPDWDVEEMLRGVGRWIWALAVGGIVGGFPATAYWLYCGDIDLFDGVILVELLALGAVYGQMALLASLLHDDPLAANPITVLKAIWQVGWGCVGPSLVGGVAVLLAIGLLDGVMGLTNPAGQAVGYWFFWVVALYEAQVVLRVLGLFYWRRSRALGWFRDRPRWGAGLSGG